MATEKISRRVLIVVIIFLFDEVEIELFSRSGVDHSIQSILYISILEIIYQLF